MPLQSKILSGKVWIMYLDAALSGILAGLLLALMALGPSFFTLIKVGIQQSFIKGAFFATGIILSDLIILLLAYLGLSQFYESLWFKQAFSLVGGMLVLAFGIHSLRHCRQEHAHFLPKQMPDYQYVIEGFGLNILNPFTFGLWLFVIATVNQFRAYTGSEIFIFYAVMLVTIFGGDLLKTYVANQTGKSLSNKILQRINHFIGIILILISFRLLYFFFSLIGQSS